MNCSKCGSPLNPNDKFCINCGTPVGAPTPAPIPPVTEYGTQAIPNLNYQQNAAQAPQFNQAPVQQPTKGNGGSAKYIALILLAVAIIAVCVVVGLSLTKKDDGKPGDSTTPGGGSQVAVNNTYKYNYGGYTFELTNDMTAEEGDSMLYLYDSSESWVSTFELTSGTYDLFKSNIAQVEQNIGKIGYEVKSSSVKTANGIEYIAFECVSGSKNLILAITKVDASHISIMQIVTDSNEYDYTILDKLAVIFKNIKAGSTNNLEVGTFTNLNTLTAE